MQGERKNGNRCYETGKTEIGKDSSMYWYCYYKGSTNSSFLFYFFLLQLPDRTKMPTLSMLPFAAAFHLEITLF